MFSVTIDRNKAWVTERETLTRYSTGTDTVQIGLDFSEEWDALSKIAVFRAYETQIDVAFTGDSVQIPVQVLTRQDVHLLFGVYGVNASGSVVIPTIWADLGIIQPGPDPTDADNYGPPALGLYAQLEALAASAAASAAAAATGAYAGSVAFTVNAVGHLIMSATQDGVTTTSDLGTVTAYGAALDGGYSGTYAQFQALLQSNAIAASTLQQLQTQLDGIDARVTAASNNASAAVTAAGEARNTANSASDAVSALETTVSGKQAKYHAVTVQLAAGLKVWQIGNVAHVTADNLVIYGAAPGSFDAAAEALVRMTEQGAGTVKFEAASETSEAITMNLAVFDN